MKLPTTSHLTGLRVMAALSGPRAGRELRNDADKTLGSCLKRVDEWKGPCSKAVRHGRQFSCSDRSPFG